jgi:hypothetical protein
VSVQDKLSKGFTVFNFGTYFSFNYEKNIMSQEKRGTRDNNPQVNQDQQQPKEGEYKNIETSVNNRSYFGDDYEVEQEAQIGQNEADTEDENNVPNRRRSD